MININKQLLSLKPSKIKQFNDLTKTYQTKNILSIGEPYFKTPKKIKNACIKSLKNNNTHYSLSIGFLDVRKKIVDFENKIHNFSYKTENVIITNGSTEGINLALLSILNEDDEVIIFIPAYNLYRQIIEFTKAKVITINTENDSFQINYDKLKQSINQNTKAIIINSPNNPTGIIYNEESQNNIIKLIQNNNIWLIIDNVYEQINFSNQNLQLIYNNKDILKQTIICQSFSKSYAMTGWRVGYLIGNNSLVNQIAKLHQMLVVSTNSFIQKTIINAIDYNNSKMIERYQKNALYAYNRLIEMGLEVIKPNGGFYLFPSIKKYSLDSWEFCERFLKEYQIAILPGICFELEGYIRISICVKYSILKESLNYLEKFINQLSDF